MTQHWVPISKGIKKAMVRMEHVAGSKMCPVVVAGADDSKLVDFHYLEVTQRHKVMQVQGAGIL